METTQETVTEINEPKKYRNLQSITLPEGMKAQLKEMKTAGVIGKREISEVCTVAIQDLLESCEHRMIAIREAAENKLKMIEGLKAQGFTQEQIDAALSR